MTDIKTLPKPEKKEIYRFTSRGNQRIVLKNGYYKPVRDSRDAIITQEWEPTLRADFENGYWQTESEEAAVLIQKLHTWGRTIFWHPSTKGLDDPGKAKAKEIDAEKIARGKRLKKARRRRIENGPVLD